MTVQNHGQPIAPAFLPIVFNPFARSGAQKRSAGLGLGLYISERIIDAHGGRLSVHSSADTGTPVETILPRSTDA